MHDDAITLAEARQRMPGQPCDATVKSWINNGVGGVRLGAIKVGGRWYTTPQWIDEFILATTSATTKRKTVSPSAAAAAGRRAYERTKRKYGKAKTKTKKT